MPNRSIIFGSFVQWKQTGVEMTKITPRQEQALRNFGFEGKYLPKTKANASLLLTYILEGNRTEGKDKGERIATFRRLFDEWIDFRVEGFGGKKGTVKGLLARSPKDVRTAREDRREEVVEYRPCPFKLLVAWDGAKRGCVTTVVISLVKKIEG